MAASEVLEAESFLESLLTADSALAALASGGVWPNAIPEGYDPPAVVFRYQGGSDTVATGAVRVLSFVDYLVEGIVFGQGRTALLADIAERVDTILQGAAGSTVAAAIYAIDRRQPFRSFDLVDGIVENRAGGTYRLWLRPS